MSEGATSGQKVGEKEQLLAEFNEIIAETEHLLKGVATTGAAVAADQALGMEASLDEHLNAARERLTLLEEALTQRAKAAVKATEEYVSAHPLQSIGIAAAVGAGVGLILGLMLRRR